MAEIIAIWLFTTIITSIYIVVMGGATNVRR